MISITAPACLFPEIPLHARMCEILELVRQRYGANALDVPVQQHAVWTQEFEKIWAQFWIASVGWANQWFDGNPTQKFYVLSSGYSIPTQRLVTATARFAAGPLNILELTGVLCAAVTTQHYSAPAEVELSLGIGEEVLPTFEWHLLNWRRLLESLWQPLQPTLSDNGCESSHKAPDQRKVLPSIEFYLKHSRGIEPRLFTVHIPIAESSESSVFETALLAQFAIYDALAQNAHRRRKPEILLEHFLKLRGKLPQAL